MQFILKQSTLVCQFASPLDVDTHNKPEAVVLEGKYWKRKLAAVTAEYKKWRMYRRNRILGCARDGCDIFSDVDMLDWQPDSNDSSSMMSMMVDQDYMEFMSDTLFSTIQSNQPFAFPDTREIAKGAGLADFIQPSLVQLQPNLDDFMDTLEPLQELLSYRLPPVPEEAIADDALLRSLPSTSASYPDLSSKSSSSMSMSQLGQPQNMGMYQQLNEPYRQPEYVSVESLGSESIDNRTLQATFSQSDLQVPMQLIQEQIQQPQPQQQPSPLLSQLPQQHIQANLSPNKTQTVRPAAQTKTRQINQTPHQPVLRKQIAHVQPHHHSHPMHQQQPYQQPQAEQQSQNVGYQLYPPSSPVLSQPQPPPLPLSMAEPPPRASINQVKMPNQSYSSQITMVQNAHLAQQAAITPDSFKFNTSLTQRSFSLPSPQTASVSYASSGSNLRSMTSGSMSNIHTASLSNTEKIAPTRSETELFAIPKVSKLRNRSRSGSSLLPSNAASSASSSNLSTLGASMGARGVRPLVSTASNPDLSTSALLAQLLTSNSSPVYNFTAGTDSPTSNRAPISKSHNIPILPMPPSVTPQSAQVPHTTALLITSSVPMTIQPSSTTGQLILNSAATATTSSGLVATGKGSDSASDSSAVPSPVGLSLSPLNMENMSPPQPLVPKADADLRMGKVTGRGEHRRVCHINAELKRRCNIKKSFDMLQSLIPQLRQNPNTKTSKAAMLQKGAEYIKQLRGERSKLKEEMNDLRQEIDKLNSAISNCQSMLPATGAPVSRHRASKMREMFDEYVRTRTLDNWKFWIFSLLVEPLLVSFNSSVSTSSVDELYRTTMQWVEKHCSLVELRPVVLNSLRYLCTSTEILSDPTRLPEEARQAVLKNDTNVGGASSSASTSSNSHQPS
ncbi:Carbohydrate-responsive element-binding protein [Frankliniella fusca]|uniref:Carbohydrate-responsive element-binding protein n=1 Tax=Frankliniella fusca TaxID=407009 RepID=A0AAE1I0K7_9NEOP|nr:Carbohydrate-responsive element-binding protein [Frankliniella fusca]